MKHHSIFVRAIIYEESPMKMIGKYLAQGAGRLRVLGKGWYAARCGSERRKESRERDAVEGAKQIESVRGDPSRRITPTGGRRQDPLVDRMDPNQSSPTPLIRIDPRILLDQIRCVDKTRLSGKLGKIDMGFWHSVLLEMLA